MSETILEDLEQLSDSLTTRNTKGYSRTTAIERGEFSKKIFFEFATGDGVTSGDNIGLCAIPANHKIVNGLIAFGAMGSGATLDLGLFGMNANGRYSDTLSTTEVTALTKGEWYKIVESGGSFANVGASSDEVGTIFKATGTSPTTAKNCVQVGTADDEDLLLDGISVASAGVDTFCSLADSDAGYGEVMNKEVVLVATAKAAFAGSKTIKGWVEVVQV